MTQPVADSVIADFARQQHYEMECVLNGSLVPTKVARLVQGQIISGDNGPTLSVDYEQSLEEMIAAGHYNKVNDKITSRYFPIDGEGVAMSKYKVFDFERSVSSDEAERLMVKKVYQPAKIEHGLAYALKFPDEQRGFPIVLLGSPVVFDVNCCVVVLSGSETTRDLSLLWRDYDWNPRCRFLGVRNLAR